MVLEVEWKMCDDNKSFRLIDVINSRMRWKRLPTLRRNYRAIYCLVQVVPSLMILDVEEDPPNIIIYHLRFEFKLGLMAAVAFEL